MKIYVNCRQPFPGMGTKACPFSTIQQAADVAMPGDEVLGHYRTIRRQRWRCLFCHLLLAEISIYLQ